MIMKRISIFIALAFTLVAPMLVAQRTTRANLRPAQPQTAESSEAPAPYALVTPGVETLRVSGYDKPLRSRRETFFVTNHAESEAVRLALTIEYLDASGRQLHKRSAAVDCEIPAGETRNLSLPSWDKQQSFYYTHSTVPTRTEQATPYDVRISVDTLYVKMAPAGVVR